MKRGTDVDLIVIGGGIVGGVLAALMAESDFSIAVVDSNPSNKLQDVEKTSSTSASDNLATEEIDPNNIDPRVFAITRASEQIFKAARIWEEIQQSPMGHFREIQVWDANGTGNIHFDSQSLCEPTLGYIIENRIIQAAINNRLGKLNNVISHCPASLEQLEVKVDKAEVVLNNGTRTSAKLIVGADGANSRVRELANINSTTYDYQQTALVCTVKSQIAHHDTARQRFLSTGPLAFLPLSEPHTCSIVWSTTPEQAQELKEISDEEFRHSLEEAFESTLGRILQTGPRFTFPISRAHAKNYVKNRIALIGDAAHRVHPLAGQGANLGILDAATLAELLLLSGQQNNDIGKTSLLRKYERWRKGENLSVLMAMDGFKHAYGSSQNAIQKLRNMGMNVVNASPPIKRLIMLKAMGLSGDLPKVARTPHFL